MSDLRTQFMKHMRICIVPVPGAKCMRAEYYKEQLIAAGDIDWLKKFEVEQVLSD